MSTSPNPSLPRPELGVPEPTRKRRLWPWFVVGFFVVFLGSFFVVTMYAADPSGGGIMQCSLWDYYSVEIPRAFKTRTLGAAGESTVRTIALEHLLISIGGGVLLLGIGWFMGKLLKR